MTRTNDDISTDEAALRSAIDEAVSDVIDADSYWRAVDVVRSRGARAIWGRVASLASHEDPRVRSLVPDILRYLGPERPFVEETLTLLRAMLSSESAPDVIASIGEAFVDLDPPDAVALMRPFATHADARVRESVVHALLGNHDPLAIQTLIVLSRDPCDAVRDWATFGLGSQLGEPGEPSFVDTPEVRDALAARLDDPDPDTRSEAIAGLELRSDPRA